LLAENLLTSAAAKEGKLNPASKKMAEMLAADDETPGKLRKVGPSLRYLASKVDESFLYDWVREPKHFRPSTKMPQFFGLHDHLGENDESAKYEPVEILAVTKYLLTASQKFDYTPAATGVESPSVERGKLAFQTRGCLACHQHPDVKEGKAVHGPDLAKLGAKLTGDKGGKWLYTWLRDPTNYHARTSMPNLFLDPQKGTDGKMVDPAADIVAYLLSQRDWQPKGIPSISPGALDELVEKYLKGAFTTVDAKKFAKDGIPAERGARVAGDEAMLVAGRGDLQNQKLLYLGKKSIGRLGCAGCHDVPGFEDAKSIGAGLADWGRKEPSKLAFEQVVTYVQGQLAGHGGAQGADGHGSSGHGGHPDLVHMDPDQGFFLEALFGHHREGFIWQKLREPRSYDYKKVENKDYLDRLRMPKFNLTDAQREAIMTFVLGLVAEPPAAKYVYKGTPRNVAIQRGRDVLEKFNCVGCHTIDMEKWEFDYEPGKLASPQPFDPAKEYAFVQPHFTPNEIEASKKVDRRGLGHAVVSGMPNPEVQEDEDGKPVWFFKPWQSVAINGNIFRAGGQEVEIPQANITAKHPPYGGDLARLLHPVVFELEKKVNPNAKASDAWGWVPPPLVNEGQKVRAEWLYEFLMQPYAIRPATVLRMPKFNLSPAESAALVDYFAAKDNAQYPYEHDSRTWSEYTMSPDQLKQSATKLDGALKIVTDNNYCVKCHLVGDYVPPGSTAALAPQLDRIADRLRPDYLQKWIANPPMMLPYTGMPVNFPADKPADQKLLAGKAEEQMQSVVDLLLNWSRLLKDQPGSSMKSRVKPPTAAPAAAPATGGE
jgi:cytochrome c551/c552